MHHDIRRCFLSFLLIFCLFHTSNSQDLEVGLSGGGAYYLGDLNQGLHFKNSMPAYGLVARYTIDTRWSVRMSASLATVKGTSSKQSILPDAGLSFSSKITDITAVVEFNFFSYFTGSARSIVTPYIFGGLGIFMFKPTTGGIDLRSLGTEGQNNGYLGRAPYATTGFGIPFGLGGKFSLTKRLSLQVYWEVHKTFTDYLDDVSTTYYLDGKLIQSGDIAAVMSDPNRNHMPGMQRGDPKTKDWYTLYGFSLTYTFDLTSSKKCRNEEY